jgi:FKBP-type peptidyl-prolyl cis-trans isomerase
MTFLRPLILLIAVISLSITTSCLKDTDSFDATKQFDIDQKLISEYLAAKNITTKVDTVIGLNYRILTEGNDTLPKSTERININYSIRTLDSDEILLSDSNKTHSFNNILLGMKILMPYTEEKGSVEMFLPSYYAFGQSQLSNLAANTPVIVELKLNKIIRNDDQQLAYDTYLIDQYIAKNNLQASIDTDSGLRYIISNPGTGFKPAGNSTMIVTYKGEILNGSEFDNGTKVTFSLGSLIQGWKILMPKIATGGKITMFIPSQYGYGSRSDISVIPSYSILKFEVELVELPQ